MSGDLLDDVFHGCAFRAYLEVWAETREFPPDCEATRRRAYRYYEQELAAKHRGTKVFRSDSLTPPPAGCGCR